MDDFVLKLRNTRRDFHQHPELGFQEKRTKKKITNYLREIGLEVYEGVGVVGVLKSGTGNRAIGLRADIDALPIQEKSMHGYPSKTPGVMHACGHDGHTTMLLGAAEKLSQSMDFDGTVVFIFQPNEEHGFGAQAMINEGLFQRFPIDEVYGIHNLPGAPAGQVSTRAGQICASENLFEITIKGKGGHASMPHVGAEALIVGAEIVLALQTIVARKMSPSSGTVVSVTEFITNGQRNVLPGQAVLKGDARARTPSDREALEKFLRQIVGGIAAAHSVEVDVEFVTEFVEVVNAPDPTDAVIRAANSIDLDTIGDRQPMSFSEDFAHFSIAVPGCFLLLGNGETGACGQPLHAADYDFNDDILSVGADLWVALVKDRLTAMPG